MAQEMFAINLTRRLTRHEGHFISDALPSNPIDRRVTNYKFADSDGRRLFEALDFGNTHQASWRYRKLADGVPGAWTKIDFRTIDDLQGFLDSREPCVG